MTMTISADLRVALSAGRVSTDWSQLCAPGRSALYSASMPRGSLAMAATGTHLLELCGLVDARVIDLDGVYDPCRPNDRLLLGMKGSISEFGLCGGNLPEALPRL